MIETFFEIIIETVLEYILIFLPCNEVEKLLIKTIVRIVYFIIVFRKQIKELLSKLVTCFREKIIPNSLRKIKELLNILLNVLKMIIMLNIKFLIFIYKEIDSISNNIK